MKALLFSVYDSFESTEKFLKSDDCPYYISVDLNSGAHIFNRRRFADGPYLTVLDNTESTMEFIVNETYDMMGFSEEVLLSEACANQQLIQAIENFKPSPEDCFVYILSPESKKNNKRPWLVPDEDFMIFELPEGTTDFRIINHFNIEFWHLYQEVVYVLDGKLHSYTFGDR